MDIYEENAIAHLAECIDFALSRIDGIRYDASAEFLFGEVFDMLGDLREYTEEVP